MKNLVMQINLNSQKPLSSFVTVRQAAKMLGLCASQVALLAQKGKIQATTLGHMYLLDKKSVINYRPGKVGRKTKQPQPVVAAPIKCGESTTEASQKQAESEVSHE